MLRFLCLITQYRKSHLFFVLFLPFVFSGTLGYACAEVLQVALPKA